VTALRATLFLAALTLAACQSAAPPAPPEAIAARPEGEDWRGALREEDTGRLDRLADAWRDGLAEARTRGFTRQIGIEGALLAPDAAQPRAALPPGSYRCRLIRLGAGPRRAAFTAYPPYFCYVGVEDALLAFTKQTGSERPAGYIWTDSDARGIFLGAMVEGAETAPRAYGQDATRDLVGIVERIGPFRYRLVFPFPQGGAKLDVLELVPAMPDAS
jgi:hypothetical protein